MSQSQQKPTFWQVLMSVLASFLGVQKAENRERDFTQGDFKWFALVGVLATILFVLILVAIVHWVLP